MIGSVRLRKQHIIFRNSFLNDVNTSASKFIFVVNVSVRENFINAGKI